MAEVFSFGKKIRNFLAENTEREREREKTRTNANARIIHTHTHARARIPSISLFFRERVTKQTARVRLCSFCKNKKRSLFEATLRDIFEYSDKRRR